MTRRTKAKTCPSCGLVNPSSAERCDCGYDFPSGQREEEPSYCPQCSAKLQDQAAYCHVCGTRVKEDPSAMPIARSSLMEKVEEEKTRIETQEKIKRQKRGKGCLTVLLVFIGLGLLGSLISERKEKRTEQPSDKPLSQSPSQLTSNLTVSQEAEPWKRDLEIVDFSWSLSEFSVATWKLRIKNKSKTKTYKDLHFKTVYFAPSGTKVDESFLGHTEYVTVSPGKTVSIKFTEFAHSQAQRAGISIDGAKIY